MSSKVNVPNDCKSLPGVRADKAAYVQATPGKDSPRLECKMYLFTVGKIQAEPAIGPTLKFMHGCAPRCAVSLCEMPPQVETIACTNFNAKTAIATGSVEKFSPRKNVRQVSKYSF